MVHLSGELLIKNENSLIDNSLETDILLNKHSQGIHFFIKKRRLSISERVLFCFVTNESVFRLNEKLQLESFSLNFKGFKNLISSPECPYRLAFWFDDDQQKFFVFREFFGRVPFFYAKIDGRIFFSTHYKDLVSNKSLRGKLTLNDDFIADYLSPYYVNSPYKESTVFREIKAVYPGYITEIINQESSFIVNFSNTQYEGFTSIDEFGEIFRKLFEKSVSSSIRPAKHISTQLSGGLDSSSIACMVRTLRPKDQIVGLHLTQQEVKENSHFPRTHDITFARDVARDKNIDLHFFPFEMENTESILSNMKDFGQPPFMKGIVRQSKIISVAKEQDCDLMLTGSLGDSVNGSGLEYLMELFAHQKWKELKKSLEDLARTDRYISLGERHDETSLNYAKYVFFRRRFLALRSKKSLKDLYDLLIIGGFKLRLNYFSITKNFIRQYELGLRTGDVLKTLFKESRGCKPAKLPHPNCKIHVNQTIRLLEDYYDLSAATQLNIDSPYCDAALYHLCESVPYNLKFFNGLGRGQVRAGLKGILTESVRIRSNKTSPVNRDNMALIWNLINNCRDLISADSSIWRYVDRATFLTNVEICKNGKPTPQSLSRFTAETFRIILLSAWLKCNEL